jgi:hypothetical protein
MSSKFSVGAVSALLLVIANSSLQAQAASAPEPAPVPTHDASASVYVAKEARSNVRIDGFVSEAVWSVAESIDRFTQVSPRAGQASSELTDVRILTTDKGILLSARLFDQQAERIVMTPGKADVFEIAFDVSHDHHAALVLTVEVNGQHHASIVRDGVKSDLPLLEWQAAARTNAKGWSAEIMLPFSALRELAPAAQWGWQARRYIARKDELSTSAQVSTTDIGEFGHLQLEGVKALH